MYFIGTETIQNPNESHKFIKISWPLYTKLYFHWCTGSVSCTITINVNYGAFVFPELCLLLLYVVLGWQSYQKNTSTLMSWVAKYFNSVLKLFKILEVWSFVSKTKLLYFKMNSRPTQNSILSFQHKERSKNFHIFLSMQKWLIHHFTVYCHI